MCVPLSLPVALCPPRAGADLVAVPLPLPQTKARGFVATAMHIVKKESPLGLYKGLGAVVTGIVPKMAIRFASFEQYKALLANKETGKTSGTAIFFGASPSTCHSVRAERELTLIVVVAPAAGLGAGVTEAVLVVCPMEVVKIRLQAQVHSMTDPLDIPKYRNAAHALYLILREEGFGTLYRGVALTALRQATNQGASTSLSIPLRRTSASAS